MLNLVDKKLCCGCYACGDICPQKAISFKTDNEGFWYPAIDKDSCLDCGLCESVCPVINVDGLKKNDLDQPECYAAENKNLEVVFDSTSGGLFSVFAEAFFRDKGYVGGAVFSEDCKSVHHFISNDRRDLEKMRSSKYLQSDVSGFYEEVRNLLNSGDKVLVSGTPCQMAALRAFLGKEYSNLYILDFICRGVNSPMIWSKYIDSFEHRYGSKVIYAKAKSKEYGWRNLTQKVILEDGRHIYETKEHSAFTRGYLFTNAYCRPSCYECKFKGFPRMADITLADFWGLENIENSLDKDLGTSLVMVNSKKGQGLFDRIKPRINYFVVPLDSVIPGNRALIQPLSRPHINRDQFFEDVNSLPFDEVVGKYIENKKDSLKTAFKRKIKNVISLKHILNRPPKAVIQTLRYNTINGLSHRNYLAFDGFCAVNIDKKATLEMKGISHIGYKRVRGSHLESRLLVEEGASLEFQGPVDICYGADIEVFKNSKLVFKGNNGANLNLTIVCGNYIEIGKDVKIGRNVTIRDNNGGHYVNRPGYKDSRPVIIGDKAWLCEGCTIMPGVKIGAGAIIGAGSFVTSNVPAHSVVAGNPAVIVDEDVIWKY